MPSYDLRSALATARRRRQPFSPIQARLAFVKTRKALLETCEQGGLASKLAEQVLTRLQALEQRTRRLRPCLAI